MILNWFIAFIFLIIQNVARINNHQKSKGTIKSFFNKYWDDIFLSIIAVIGLMIWLCNDFGIFVFSKIHGFNLFGGKILDVGATIQEAIDNGFKSNILMSIAAIFGLFNYSLIKSSILWIRNKFKKK